MSRIVVKVGGAVAADSAGAVLELAPSTRCASSTAPGPQISAEMERAGIPVEFVDGRRVTTPEGIAIVRASLAAVNAALCAAIGERAVPLFGDEIGLEADPRSRSSASSATRSRRGRPRSSRRSRRA